MTPKERMTKTTMSLARAVKPSGRLNKDDMINARANRSKMSLSQIKDAKKLGKIKKMASKMGVAGSMKGIKELMEKVSNAKKRDDLIKDPSRTKRPGSRPNTNSKTKTPSSRPSDRRPMGTKALGPLRPLRERSQSKLVSRRRGINKR